MKGLDKALFFTFGAIAGGVGTWFGVKTYYEQRANKEIEEVKKAYWNLYTDDLNNGVISPSQNASVTHQNAPESILAPKDDQMFDKREKTLKTANKRSGEKVDYNKISSEIIENQGYNTTSPVVDKAELEAPVESSEKKEKPYFITPHEFDHGQYEKIELTYYDGDGVVADDFDEMIDVHETFPGLEIGSEYGMNEEEPDIVFIRDDVLKLDYEIVRKLANYADVIGYLSDEDE